MTPTTESPILELVDLEKVFRHDIFKKRQTVISGLSCQFFPGQCTGFMGHNGAGKTTTIRTIFGLIKPDKGKVIFKGHVLTRRDKTLIGYMPEVNKLPANLTCHEVLHHQLRVFQPKGMKSSQYKAVIEEKLREIGLWDHRHRRISKLSKGLGRRLAFGQATIHNPELVILDEPFSGLDPVGRDQMLGWIRSLKQRRAAVILCTHELWTVPFLCDQVHVIRQGRLVFSTLAKGPNDQKTSNKKHYVLHVSGCEEATLTHLKASSDLPSWRSLSQEKFLAKLSFNSYPEAAVWMKTCLDNGYVIVRFDEVSDLDPNALMPYFEGGHA